MSEPSLRSRMANLLFFIPNMLVLCARLMVDGRVPAKERLLVAGAIVYAVVPLDLFASVAVSGTMGSEISGSDISALSLLPPCGLLAFATGSELSSSFDSIMRGGRTFAITPAA